MAKIPSLKNSEPFTGFEQDGEIYLWITRRLWDLAKSLPVFEYDVASFDCFDQDVWFNSQHIPTVNKVLEHYKKIEKASFEHPIILSKDGVVLDGVHRICRAHLDGRKTIPAVRFEVDPEPDYKHKVSQP